jgi:hypothetical protein
VVDLIVAPVTWLGPSGSAYVRSPLSTIVECLDWYVAFATALLPLVILLGRRGVAGHGG